MVNENQIPGRSLLAALSGNGSMGDALMTGLILLVVVFATLCVLSLIIWLFGRIGGTGSRSGGKKAAQTAARPSAPLSQPAAAQNAVSAPVTGEPADEDEEAVAAAIAAAVAMMAPAGTAYRVSKITPSARTSRPAWAAAAVQQNTAPF